MHWALGDLWASLPLLHQLQPYLWIWAQLTFWKRRRKFVCLENGVTNGILGQLKLPLYQSVPCLSLFPLGILRTSAITLINWSAGQLSSQSFRNSSQPTTWSSWTARQRPLDLHVAYGVSETRLKMYFLGGRDSQCLLFSPTFSILYAAYENISGQDASACAWLDW